MGFEEGVDVGGHLSHNGKKVGIIACLRHFLSEEEAINCMETLNGLTGKQSWLGDFVIEAHLRCV